MSDDAPQTGLSATLTDAWVRMSETAFRAATAMGRVAGAARESTGRARDGSEADDNPDVVGPSIPSLAFENDDWTFERSVESRDDISVGDTVTFTRRLTEADVRQFAVATGDTNRLHLDDEFAGGSRFGTRIAHGALVSGTISAALARLPGLTIYLSQDLEFRRPVDVGARIAATVEVIEDLGDDRYRLSTTVEAGATTVVDGEATVLVDDLPD